jgi:hypothetical protein
VTANVCLGAHTRDADPPDPAPRPGGPGVVPGSVQSRRRFGNVGAIRPYSLLDSDYELVSTMPAAVPEACALRKLQVCDVISGLNRESGSYRDRVGSEFVGLALLGLVRDREFVGFGNGMGSSGTRFGEQSLGSPRR